MIINEDGELIDGNSKLELEDYLNKYYYFRFNEVTSKIYWKEIGNKDFVELSEYDINSLLRILKNENIKCGKSELIQVLTSDFTQKFNPFKEYHDGLNQWDEQTDFIGELADTITTTSQQLWRKCFRKWMVALVGCVLDKDVVNQTAPILCGGQGIGKTTWVGNLVPNELKEYFYSGSVITNSKDSITQISECILIDMDELENVGKKSIGDLKSLMTRKDIRIRRPYGRVAENLPRRASFIGSINHKEFLKDETGSRRFLCFEIVSINNDHGINIADVYAQALSLFKTGYRFWFNSEEIQEVQLNNEQFQETSLEMELIMRFFEPVPADKASMFLSSTDIAEFLHEKHGLPVNNTTVQHIGKALSAKKFINVTRKDRKVWAVSYKLRKAA